MQIYQDTLTLRPKTGGNRPGQSVDRPLAGPTEAASLDINGEPFAVIRQVGALPPFLMSIVSNSNRKKIGQDLISKENDIEKRLADIQAQAPKN